MLIAGYALADLADRVGKNLRPAIRHIVAIDRRHDHVGEFELTGRLPPRAPAPPRPRRPDVRVQRRSSRTHACRYRRES